MIKIFNRKKDYIVSISSNGKVQYVQVRAKNKKEALSMVKDVLMKCSVFGFHKENSFKLNCKKGKGVISKLITSFFMKGRKGL